MEDQNNEKQKGTANHKEDVQKILTPKVKAPKSKLRKWMFTHRDVDKKYRGTEQLLDRNKDRISDILSGAIPSDGKYHPVPSTMVEEILMRKKLDPKKKPFDKIIRNLRLLETNSGIQLSVNLPRWRWKPMAISKHFSFQLKGYEIKPINLTTKGKSKKHLGQTSKTHPPLDIADLEDFTSDMKQKDDIFLNLISKLENKYSPTVVKYKYNPRFSRLQQEEKRALLLYIPRGVNPSYLQKLYGTKLRRIWEDFYDTKAPKGRHPLHKAEQTIRKAMRALEKEGKITPGTPMERLPKLIEEKSQVLHKQAPNRWMKYKWAYIETFGSVMREQMRRIKQRAIIESIREMAEKNDISRMPDDELILCTATKWKMSSQVRARFKREFLPFYRKEKRKYAKGGG